jgi:hypothetical protein
MPRPKRPFNGMETVHMKRISWMEDDNPGQLGTQRRRRWMRSTHWKYVAKNGIYDPLTYLFVLDAVANMHPDIELRAKNLTEWLNRNIEQFYWDAITVGKVLAELHEAFEDVLGKKFGILEAGLDYRGRFYLLHHNPETARLYYSLREDLMKLADVEITARARGAKSDRLLTPLLECPSVRLNWQSAEQLMQSSEPETVAEASEAESGRPLEGVQV